MNVRQENEAVLRDLGYGAGEIRKLFDDRVIFDGYRDVPAATGSTA